MQASARAVVFIDGNNWYHSLVEARVPDVNNLDYRAISAKLAGPARTWIGTRYYVGQLKQEGNLALYAGRRRFVAGLQASDPRITVHYGRIETRWEGNPAASEIKRYLAELQVRIDPAVYRELIAIAQRHEYVEVRREKAVDVMLAVDVVTMAQQAAYDHAYLLSRDGDLAPAVETARLYGRKVYVASPSPAAQLARVANATIPLRVGWFDDCYR